DFTAGPRSVARDAIRHVRAVRGLRLAGAGGGGLPAWAGAEHRGRAGRGGPRTASARVGGAGPRSAGSPSGATHGSCRGADFDGSDLLGNSIEQTEDMDGESRGSEK